MSDAHRQFLVQVLSCLQHVLLITCFAACVQDRCRSQADRGFGCCYINGRMIVEPLETATILIHVAQAIGNTCLRDR